MTKECVYVYVCTYVYACVCVCVKCMYICICICIYKCIYMYIYIYIYIILKSHRFVKHEFIDTKQITFEFTRLKTEKVVHEGVLPCQFDVWLFESCIIRLKRHGKKASWTTVDFGLGKLNRKLLYLHAGIYNGISCIQEVLIWNQW